MKQMKKFTAILLSILLCMSAWSIAAFAENESVTVSMLNYNVSGLPDINYLLGKGGRNVNSNQQQLGSLLNQSGYDVIAVQEDFGYHRSLVAGLSAYSFKTIHSGSIPGGDGLNIFTKGAAIYNAKRTEWNVSGGPISDGDSLTPKGILYAVLDLGNDIFLDFYNIHADAFDNDDSTNARAKQYKQLMDLVEKNSADRPVIITGDFNTTLSLMNSVNNADEIAMLEQFVNRGGFKDAWMELNGASYSEFDASNYSWGKSDSVEKFLFKSGGGIEIVPSGFSYETFSNSKGESISDHSAAACTFTFTKTAAFAPDARAHKVATTQSYLKYANMLKWIVKDLIQIFANWNDVKAFLGI